jgi:hypothetical protein
MACSLYGALSRKIAKWNYKYCHKLATVVLHSVHFETTFETRWARIFNVTKTFKVLMVGIINHANLSDLPVFFKNIPNCLLGNVVRQVLHKECFATNR